jgi:hypothetical protein
MDDDMTAAHTGAVAVVAGAWRPGHPRRLASLPAFDGGSLLGVLKPNRLERSLPSCCAAARMAVLAWIWFCPIRVPSSDLLLRLWRLRCPATIDSTWW